jgi:hypothetical protein
MIKKLGLLGVLSFATLGAFMLFSPGKASASVVDCGTSNWGITTGNTSSDAGLIIHAQLSNGTEVNVSYRLVDVSSPNNYSIWRATNGTNSTNYSSLTRSTGSDFYTSSSGSTAHCDGYDVYGYGTSGSNGNRYALDCHQVTSGGSYTTATAYFQIQSVAAPAGHPYGSWSGDNATFTVTNGGNKTITLTWTDATVPVSGKVYDGANSVGIPSVRIVVCGISANNYTAADTTDSAGNWAVTIKKGNQFCVRLTQTSSTNATLLTPAGYDPNVDAFQRSEHSTANSYEQQSAGVSCYHDTSPVFGCDGYPSTSYSTANTTYDWDLGDANNFRFYKWVTVSGRLYNGATNAGFANVTIVSCGSNPSDTTDANGNWSIRVRQTTRFCVHPQVSGVAFSPGSGYTPVAVNAPTEHSTGVQYEYQVAAMNCYHDTSPPPGCQNPAQTGAASNNSDYYWDRAITSVSDTGYDIKYTPPNTPADTPPTVTITPNCGSRNAVINVNDPNGGTSTISYSIDGVAQPSQTTNSYTVNMSGYDQTVPHTINASSPGTPPSGGTVGAPVNAAPATYGQGSGGCVSPDSPPTITISPSCANKNAVITVNDPNGGTSTITYNIDGGSNQSQTANSITVNMSSYDQYKPHTINASSPGVPPSGGTVGPPVSSTATYGQGGARGCTDGVFTITPNGSTNLLPNQEDPTSVTFGATLTTVANPSYPPNAIPVTVFRDFYFVKYNTAVEIPLLLSTTTVTTADQPLATVTDRNGQSGQRYLRVW